MVEARREAGGAKIRLGMVGGGEGAFIGAVHRMAARLDGHYELVAGALSATPEKALRSARSLGLDDARSYPDFDAMAKAEARRPDGIEAVAIVAPNHVHAPAAKAFLRRGIHVICDKPLALNLREARSLGALAAKSGMLLAVTYNYTGYPMVRHAREMIASGALGALRVVQVEYAQEWLSEPLEATGHKQAEWRVDPARAGAGGCLGDIGTHAFQLAEFVTGLAVEAVAADVATMVPGRPLDDNAHVLLRFAGGARGQLWASQVAPGNENALRLRVYGERGGLSWSQEDPNRLSWTQLGQTAQTITRGGVSAGAAAARVTRVPSGHPEGYIEAFATLYSEVALAIRATRDGNPPPPEALFPDVRDGVRGLAFIEAALASSRNDARWRSLA